MKNVCCSRTPTIHDCAAPSFSFYGMIDKLGMRGAEQPLHRACSLIRKQQIRCSRSAKEPAPLTMVEETLSAYQEFELENEAISEARDATSVRSEAVRLSFFASRMADAADISAQSNADFLGYLIVKKNFIDDESPRANVYEAVLRMPALLNNYMHAHSVFDTRCGDSLFRVSGAFYAQQNGVTNVCLTASLRMVLNTLPQFQGKRLSNEQLNQVMGISPKNAHSGADADCIYRALDHFGVPWVSQDYFIEPNEDYWKFLHAILDSGCPGFLVFGCRDFRSQATAHVVPVIGHTLNTDTWFSQAQFAYNEVLELQWHDTSQWAPELIIQDDNFGMYYCLESSAMRKITLPKHDPLMRAKLCIGLLPTDAKVTPRKAQEFTALTIAWLAKNYTSRNVWVRRLFDAFRRQQADRGNRPVLRTFMVSKGKYLEHLGQACDREGRRLAKRVVAQLKRKLPDFVWITEVTLVDLFAANKRKVGELLHATSQAKDDNLLDCLVIRFPDSVMIRSLEEDEATVLNIRQMGHTPVLRLLPDVPEW